MPNSPAGYRRLDLHAIKPVVFTLSDLKAAIVAARTAGSLELVVVLS